MSLVHWMMVHGMKKKKNRDKTMKVESTGGKRERARETRKEEKKGEWMSAFRASF